MRAFIASLLQSDLSVHEMHELADELSFGKFGPELSDFLRDVMRAIDVGVSKEVDRYDKQVDFGSPRAMLSLALDIVSHRKLTKRMILQLMGLASPWFTSEKVTSSETTRGILEKYMAIAPHDEAAKFLGILGGEPADAYMKGIALRDRGK